MNHERSSIQMPCVLVWKRPAEADMWDAAWSRVPLAGSDTVSERVTPRQPPIGTALARVDSAPQEVVAADCHDWAHGPDGLEPKLRRNETKYAPTGNVRLKAARLRVQSNARGGEGKRLGIALTPNAERVLRTQTTRRSEP